MNKQVKQIDRFENYKEFDISKKLEYLVDDFQQDLKLVEEEIDEIEQDLEFTNIKKVEVNFGKFQVEKIVHNFIDRIANIDKVLRPHKDVHIIEESELNLENYIKDDDLREKVNFLINARPFGAEFKIENGALWAKCQGDDFFGGLGEIDYIKEIIIYEDSIGIHYKGYIEDTEIDAMFINKYGVEA